ncbi:hypothetical protein [Paractinoplanes ferrugineus]|uniref:hypothetical protein n=1 Tax=Paractinoplanes ferrugineus TaxID=113564 RepID=UPI0019436316|nr:hypothetical protein [Actinoplanes ferrugineus]
MADPGVVRSWIPSEGWGVLDSSATPGGCWAHSAAPPFEKSTRSSGAAYRSTLALSFDLPRPRSY